MNRLWKARNVVQKQNSIIIEKIYSFITLYPLSERTCDMTRGGRFSLLREDRSHFFYVNLNIGTGFFLIYLLIPNYWFSKHVEEKQFMFTKAIFNVVFKQFCEIFGARTFASHGKVSDHIYHFHPMIGFHPVYHLININILIYIILFVLSKNYFLLEKTKIWDDIIKKSEGS